MGNKFTIPKHNHKYGHPCDGKKVFWRMVEGKRVARCTTCEQLITFERALKAAMKKPLPGCGNGRICGNCYKCR